MPKKAATARNSVQRNKAKAQKSFEVVRQNAEGQELNEDEQLVEITPIDAPTPLAEVHSTKSARRAATRASVATQEVETATETEVATSETEIDAELAPIAPIAPTIPAKGSASARMAARRGQKLQQRTPATLVTSEHYAYVTRDLMIIAVLATIMFIAIIVLYFTIGRGA
jgi:hypothetical protein